MCKFFSLGTAGNESRHYGLAIPFLVYFEGNPQRLLIPQRGRAIVAQDRGH
jgi:hypothetical protein